MIDERFIRALPPESAVKLQALSEARRRAHAPLSGLFDSKVEAGDLLFRAKQRRSELAMMVYASGTRLSDDDPRMIAADAEIERAEARLAIAREAETEASLEWGAWAFVDNVEAWLRDNLRSQFAHAQMEPPKVNAGNYIGAVEKVRAQIEARKAAWEVASGAPVPAADLRRAMEQAVDVIAEAGEPGFDRRTRAGDPFKLKQNISLNLVSGNIVGQGGAPFLIWLLGDVIKNRLGEIIGDEDPPGALSHADREAALDKIAAEILDLERQEEALISAAAERRQHVPRRRDADPRAILELQEAD